jgi:hypothetical protein
MSISDEEFSKTKNILVEKLVAAALGDTKLFEKWMQELSTMAAKSDTLDTFKALLEDYIKTHSKYVLKCATKPILERGHRMYVCHGCKIHIEKGMLSAVIDGRRLCSLCAMILMLIKGDIAKEFLEKIKELITHRTLP